MLIRKEFYAHPYECPHFDGSWCDRVVLRAPPAFCSVVGDCWIWTGWNNAKPGGAYGKVKIRGRTDYIHRVMWERYNGVLLQGGEVIDHICRVRLCFSPHHIECVDHEENAYRREGYATQFSETRFDDALEQDVQEGLNPAYWR